MISSSCFFLWVLAYDVLLRFSGLAHIGAFWAEVFSSHVEHRVFPVFLAVFAVKMRLGRDQERYQDAIRTRSGVDQDAIRNSRLRVVYAPGAVPIFVFAKMGLSPFGNRHGLGPGLGARSTSDWWALSTAFFASHVFVVHCLTVVFCRYALTSIAFRRTPNSAKTGTFGTALSLVLSHLTPIGTAARPFGPRVFRGETACMARFGAYWHGFTFLLPSHTIGNTD